MKREYVAPTEMGKQRHLWFKKHVKPGMALDEIFQLNVGALALFPMSTEGRRLKTECLMAMPEFVL